jgi:hypothetical protein
MLHPLERAADRQCFARRVRLVLGIHQRQFPESQQLVRELHMGHGLRIDLEGLEHACKAETAQLTI